MTARKQMTADLVSKAKSDTHPTPMTFELANMDGEGNTPEWVPDDWQDVVGRIINAHDIETVATVTGAVALGWRLLLVIDEDDITIVSPDGKQKLHFAVGNRHRVDRVRRQITKLALPNRRDDLAELDGDVWGLFEKYPERVVPIDLIQPAPPKLKAVDEPYVIETKPMLAKSRKGRGYESKIAIERTWSDGSTDYKCVLCDYTKENRLSMRGHWQKHINSGEAAAVGGPRPGETFQTDVPNAASYMPRQTRIDALAALIAGMLENDEFDPDELALAALTWVHDQSARGTGHASEREDLTDTEIVHRMRLLLGMQDPAELERLTAENARLVEQLDTLEKASVEELTRARDELKKYDDDLVELGSIIENLTGERDRWMEKAGRLQGDLQSLRDLIAGIGDDEEEK